MPVPGDRSRHDLERPGRTDLALASPRTHLSRLEERLRVDARAGLPTDRNRGVESGRRHGERAALLPSIEQLSNAVSGVTLRGIAYRHVLVAYDGTSEGDEAIVAADLLAQQGGSRLTIVVVVELERPSRLVTRWPRGTRVWNDVLLDRARADLERAARLVEAPAHLTVLFGSPDRAIPDGATEFDCDAIMLPPRPRRRLARLISRDHAAAIRRHALCEVLQPR